ncbi:MAG: hypothetical protein ACRDJG_03140 [Actinomycetota bacterium]
MSRTKVPSPHGFGRDGGRPSEIIPAPPRRVSVDPSGLLALQRLIGNRAVTALIQSGDIGHLGVQRAVPAPPGPAGSDVSSGQGVELALPPEVRDPEGSFEQRPVTSIEVTAQAQVTKLDNALQ